MSLVFGFVGNQACLKVGMGFKIVMGCECKKNSVPLSKARHRIFIIPLSTELTIKNVTLLICFFPFLIFKFPEM